MAGKVTSSTAVKALLLILLIVIEVPSTALSQGETEIDRWIQKHIQAYVARKEELREGVDTALEPALKAAEASRRVIKVRKNGAGDFRTVTEAISTIPAGNTKRTIVWIGPGVFEEKIKVNRSQPFVTFFALPKDKPTLVYHGTAKDYGTVDSASVIVESDYFMAVNIIFKNSAPEPDGKREGAQAVAMRISGDMAAFYGCSFIGFQDTLCDDKGRHFFKDCYIEGTVDYIFGNGKSIYLNTELHSVSNRTAFITAQARERVDDDSGYSFIHCKITGNGETYLGRAWKDRGRVVYAYTYMGTHVKAEGWSNFGVASRDKTVFYGEYECKGPGAATKRRVPFVKLLTKQEAEPFLSLTYIHGITWLLPPPVL
ncbi:PREDICTED: putative pectinesterase 63 [Nelumbo nucifera]|nr:PREDICTED: putative pectinesterase 63 [Nelumbo nucifera]